MGFSISSLASSASSLLSGIGSRIGEAVSRKVDEAKNDPLGSAGQLYDVFQQAAGAFGGSSAQRSRGGGDVFMGGGGQSAQSGGIQPAGKKFKKKLRGMSPEQLQGLARNLYAQASSGGPQAGKAAGKLQAVINELNRRGNQPTAPNQSINNGNYAQGVQQMSDQQLQQERANQLERYHNLSAGQTPNAAGTQEAAQNLSIIADEQLRRFNQQNGGSTSPGAIQQPITQADLVHYQRELRGFNNEQLDNELSRLNSSIDSSSGTQSSGGATNFAANARRRVVEVQNEQQTRSSLQSGPQPQYAQTIHGLSDRAVRSEIDRQQFLLRSSGSGVRYDAKAVDEASQKLQVLREEVSRRRGHDLQDVFCHGGQPWLQAA